MDASLPGWDQYHGVNQKLAIVGSYHVNAIILTFGNRQLRRLQSTALSKAWRSGQYIVGYW